MPSLSGIMYPEARPFRKRMRGHRLSHPSLAVPSGVAATCPTFATLPSSYILLEGDHRDMLWDIYAAFGYPFSNAHIPLHSFAELSQSLAIPSQTRKAACYSQGWTVIIDPACILRADDAACAELSLLYHCRVLSVLIAARRQSYALSLFENDETLRELRVLNGSIQANHGLPLPGEPSEIATLTEQDMLSIVGAMGVELTAVPNCGAFYLDDFTPDANSPSARHDLLRMSPPKPWWHIWH